MVGRSQLRWVEIQKKLEKEGAWSQSPASRILFSLHGPWQVPSSELWIRRLRRVAPEFCHRYRFQWVGGRGRVTSSGGLLNA